MFSPLIPHSFSSYPLTSLSPPDRVLCTSCIQQCTLSQISPLSPAKHPVTSLRNLSYVPSPSTPYHSFHFHFCSTGRIDHRSGGQGLPLCGSSFRSSPSFISSYSSSQGGRLVTERRMVTDMYVFDLKTLVWEKIVAPADDCTPAQRYFHSADSCKCRSFSQSYYPFDYS